MDRRDALAAAFRRCDRANLREGSIRGTNCTAVENIQRIRRCTSIAPMLAVPKILCADRLAMIGQESLPQLVVYGNPAHVAATSGRKRQLSANSGVGCSFGLESAPNSIFIKHT
jgi:hypothetical protein